MGTGGSRSEEVGEGRQGMAERVERTGTRMTSAIGDRLHRAGDFLEEKGKGTFLAGKLQSAGRYLKDNDTRSVLRSIDGAICAHPYRSIFIGLGVGWVVGKFLSRD